MLHLATQAATRLASTWPSPAPGTSWSTRTVTPRQASASSRSPKMLESNLWIYETRIHKLLVLRIYYQNRSVITMRGFLKQPSWQTIRVSLNASWQMIRVIQRPAGSRDLTRDKESPNSHPLTTLRFWATQIWNVVSKSIAAFTKNAFLSTSWPLKAPHTVLWCPSVHTSHLIFVTTAGCLNVLAKFKIFQLKCKKLPFTQFCRKTNLLQIHALSSVKFFGLKLRLCKQNDKYEVYKRCDRVVPEEVLASCETLLLASACFKWQPQSRVCWCPSKGMNCFNLHYSEH